MQLVEELMSHYLDKTDGAFIDKKESTIVFDYTDADS
jgi:trehalose-6-phosphatase